MHTHTHLIAFIYCCLSLGVITIKTYMNTSSNGLNPVMQTGQFSSVGSKIKEFLKIFFINNLLLIYLINIIKGVIA